MERFILRRTRTIGVKKITEVNRGGVLLKFLVIIKCYDKRT